MTDDELKEFCFDFREGILEGDSPESMCFAISAPLEGLLNIYGVPAELIEFEIEGVEGITNHFCLKLPDGRILDATADQFNEPLEKKMPKVYLGEIPNWYKSFNHPRPTVTGK
jgi:hypothetical protein